MSKLALGTAQFGLDYGINNQRGKIPDQEIKEILSLAVASGIDTLDTASAYGDSEVRLGRYLAEIRQTLKIISKLPKDAVDPAAEITNSLKKLRLEKLYGYLFHDFRTFAENRKLWEQVSALKEQGRIDKIGLSLYYPAELEQALNNGIKLDLVQVPYNIFDRRFEEYFPKLKKQGVEIHVRSIFLQGLFFRDIDSLSPYFDRVKDKLIKLRQAADRAKRTLPELAIGFALANKAIDKIVVGVDSLANLRELVAAEKSGSIADKFFDLREDDEAIVLPFKWEKERVNV